MPNFISFAASIAELAHGKNWVLIQSINNSPSLPDVSGTEIFASEFLHFIGKNDTSLLMPTFLHDWLHWWYLRGTLTARWNLMGFRRRWCFRLQWTWLWDFDLWPNPYVPYMTVTKLAQIFTKILYSSGTLRSLLAVTLTFDLRSQKVISTSTLWVKKVSHPNYGYNCVNSWSICKIRSLLQRQTNFQQNPY